MKKIPKKLDKTIPEVRMKYEIAEELGLLPKIEECGWKSLTARESGKIGGLLSKKIKQQQN